MRALGHALWWYQTAQQSSAHPQEKPPIIPPFALPAPSEGSWSEYTTRAFLQTQGIPIVPSMLATNVEDAVRAARLYGLPVAMKISASAILHKSDVGGVMLNVASEDDVRQSFHTIMHNVDVRTDSSTIDGILISPMRPSGIEMLVGIINDASWGQALVIGLGASGQRYLTIQVCACCQSNATTSKSCSPNCAGPHSYAEDAGNHLSISSTSRILSYASARSPRDYKAILTC